jgi:hypothetical protein
MNQALYAHMNNKRKKINKNKKPPFCSLGKVRDGEWRFNPFSAF